MTLSRAVAGSRRGEVSRSLRWPGPGAARVVLALSCALFATIAAQGSFDTGSLALGFGVLVTFVLFATRPWDLVSLRLVATAPLLGMVLFASLDLSEIAVELEPLTFALILGVIVIFGVVLLSGDLPTGLVLTAPQLRLNRPMWAGTIALFVLLTALNVVFAGYVPLLRLLSTGDSGYLDFGIGGLYGFYLAYANALAVTAFYLWCVRGDRVYLLTVGLVLVVFAFFVTRQNVLSVLVECFFVYCVFRRRIPVARVGVYVLLLLVAFSAFGELRSGDIRDIAQIREEYRDLPQAVFWLYSYFYFNVLNLNSLVLDPSVPVGDFSSFFPLLPSFIRPESVVSGGDYLVLSNFTVSSFIYPLYLDLGWPWVFTFALLIALLARAAAGRLAARAGLFEAGTVAVLYFCFLFSFFVNFWFYLPIVSQVLFFWILSRLVVVPVAGPRSGTTRRSAGGGP